MTDSAGNLLFALLTTPFAVYVVRHMWPFRRIEGETALDLYFRFYWNPGTAIVCAGVFWLGVVGRGPLAHSGGWTPFIALGFAVLVAGGTAGHQQRLTSASRQ